MSNTNVISKLPKKRKGKLYFRRTLCISEETKTILDYLDNNTDVDVPATLRQVIDDYVVKFKDIIPVNAK